MYLSTLLLVGLTVFMQMKGVRSKTISNKACTPAIAMKEIALVDKSLRMCFFTGQWSYLLCNPNLGQKEAAVICRELGQCKGATCSKATGKNVGSPEIVTGLVNFPLNRKCKGDEAKLSDCDSDTADCNENTENRFFEVTCPEAALTEKIDLKNGNWTTWSPWADCSVSCGGGTQRRVRSCEYPDPENKGDICQGDSTQNRDCATNPCPIDGGWSVYTDWSACSTSCGKGVQERTRTCTDPAPSNGGKVCEGNSTELRSCNEGACPVDGGWDNWSPWSKCSTICGDGEKRRSRTCTKPAPSNGGAGCPGNAVEKVECNLYRCPIAGRWSGWGPYSTCTVSCGGGTKTRTRSCNDPIPENGGADCDGDGKEIVTCNAHGCPVDGAWGQWKDWSACSATCGNGTQQRERACDKPLPQSGGKLCAGDSVEKMACFQQHCAVNGGWGSWSKFSACKQKRIRKCYRIDGKCPGDSFEFRDCKNKNCNCEKVLEKGCEQCKHVKLNGIFTCRPKHLSDGKNHKDPKYPTDNNVNDQGWGKWSAWGVCEQSRDRQCNNPEPRYGGRNCVGSSHRTCTETKLEACEMCIPTGAKNRCKPAVTS